MYITTNPAKQRINVTDFIFSICLPESCKAVSFPAIVKIENITAKITLLSVRFVFRENLPNKNTQEEKRINEENDIPNCLFR